LSIFEAVGDKGGGSPLQDLWQALHLRFLQMTWLAEILRAFAPRSPAILLKTFVSLCS